MIMCRKPISLSDSGLQKSISSGQTVQPYNDLSIFLPCKDATCGDILVGTVYIRVYTPLLCSRLKLKVVGYEKVNWAINLTPVEGRIRALDAELTLHTFTGPLFEEGVHAFPFSLILSDKTLPCSTYVNSGDSTASIQYCLKSWLDEYDSTKTYMMSSEEFFVQPCLRPTKPISVAGNMDVVDSRFCFCVMRERTTSFSLWSDGSNIVPGDVLSLRYELTNYHRQPIVQLELQIQQQLHLSDGRTGKARRSGSFLRTLKTSSATLSRPVRSGGTGTGLHSMRVPEGLPCSCTSRLITLEYVLSVTARLADGSCGPVGRASFLLQDPAVVVSLGTRGRSGNGSTVPPQPQPPKLKPPPPWSCAAKKKEYPMVKLMIFPGSPNGTAPWNPEFDELLSNKLASLLRAARAASDPNRELPPLGPAFLSTDGSRASPSHLMSGAAGSPISPTSESVSSAHQVPHVYSMSAKAIFVRDYGREMNGAGFSEPRPAGLQWGTHFGLSNVNEGHTGGIMTSASAPSPGACFNTSSLHSVLNSGSIAASGLPLTQSYGSNVSVEVSQPQLTRI